MKPHIELGAYGWQHAHWLNTFYPADLPEDWQLTYYSNAFNTVLVPAAYWQAKDTLDCAGWLDAVHPGFQFYVEYRAGMLDHVPLAELTDNLKNLGPRLSALVFLDEKQPPASAERYPFITLVESLEVAVLGSTVLPIDNVQNIWRLEKPQAAGFAWIENDLTDLRSARKIIDDFVSLYKDQAAIIPDATMIVDHPALQANDLSKFRSLIEIMGY